MPGLTRGPMCGSETGADWIDNGTLALIQNRARKPQSAPRTEGPRAKPQGFTVAYADANGSFEKAARTWRESQPHITFISHGFRTIADLDFVFRLLEHEGKSRSISFSCGALFLHSSSLTEDANSPERGVHVAPLPPRTLAELRYKEEVLAPAGLDINTASAAMVQKLRPLRWARGATLQVVGCLSGGTPEQPASVAQVLALSQKVRTTGETGKAYFSSDPARFVPIKKTDNTIYLRAFHIKKNHLLGALEGELSGLLSHGEPMATRNFDPP